MRGAAGATLAEQGCNIEVALIDTEGEMAIDVFYVTLSGAKLEEAQKNELGSLLIAAIAGNSQ